MAKPVTDPTTLLGLSRVEAITLIQSNGDLWRILINNGIEMMDDGQYIENRFSLVINAQNRISAVVVR